MKILIITNENYKSNSAYSRRLDFYIKIFSYLKYEITIICTGYLNKNELNYEIKTIRYSEPISGYYKNIKNLFMAKKKILRIYQKYLYNEKYDFVFLGGGYTRLFLPAKKISLICSGKLIIDVCEWFSVWQFPFAFMDPTFIDNRYAMRKLYKKSCGIFVISDYMYNYYTKKEKGFKVMQIPPLCNCNEDYTSFEEINSSLILPNSENLKIKIIYAGFFGKSKDYIKHNILKLSEYPDICSKVEFHLCGSSMKIKKRNIDKYNYIVQHGMVDSETVKKYIKESDYSIIIRKNNINSKAGFSTKIVESMEMGVPIICNLFGDLHKYLFHKKNAYILSGYRFHDFLEGIKEIANLNSDLYLQMKKQAYITAKDYFNYYNYVDSIKSFLYYIKRENI